MKAPKRRRPLKRAIAGPCDRLVELSAKVSYVGSPEHKGTQSFAGHPRPRATATLCDPRLADRQDEVNLWLKEAFRRGNVSLQADGLFPRYCWHEFEGQVYEGRLTNAGKGEYKGYPLLASERPGEFREA